MKAITLWQPWASLIALGYKTIETRGHDSFRCLKGQRIAIHAGKQFQPGVLDYVSRFKAIRIEDQDIFDKWACPVSAVLCTALVADARWLTPSDNKAALCECDERRFGLVLVDIQAIHPLVPQKGAQGIWEWKP
jgi:hypothetical protein